MRIMKLHVGYMSTQTENIQILERLDNNITEDVLQRNQWSI